VIGDTGTEGFVCVTLGCMVRMIDLRKEARLTSLFTKSRRRFCSCSGLSRRSVNIRDNAWVRTYESESRERVYIFAFQQKRRSRLRHIFLPRGSAERRRSISSANLRNTTTADVRPSQQDVLMVDLENT
jgi:hypothetical protein